MASVDAGVENCCSHCSRRVLDQLDRHSLLGRQTEAHGCSCRHVENAMNLVANVGLPRTKVLAASSVETVCVQQGSAQDHEELTFASEAPEAPKLTLMSRPWLGGFPPLAAGCGMGVGEFDGEVKRGFERV